MNGTISDASATGGTLHHNTAYYYRVSATDAAGETLASTETSHTTANSPAPDTYQVKVTWGAVTGATGYKVYCRSTGAELLCATISSGTTLSWTDDGSVTPSGALPTVDSSGIILLNASPTALKLNVLGSCLVMEPGNTQSVCGTSQGLKLAATIVIPDSAGRSFGSASLPWGHITSNGVITSATEYTLTSWYFNAAAATGSCPATGTGCIAHILPAQAFTVTGITGEVSVASGGGAANTVWTITDGTNTCTVTIPCNSAPPGGTSSAGPVRVAGVNGAGTGCAYAASATLSISVTTAGCTATQPTFKNVDILGIWQ